jgi:hypothetical protein
VGLTKTHPDWSGQLDATLTATRRDDIKHGTAGVCAWLRLQ